jgi:hypothetical protein
VTRTQTIATYNQLDKAMAITNELIKLYKPEANVLKELLMAYQAMKMAQNNLDWDPEVGAK